MSTQESRMDFFHHFLVTLIGLYIFEMIEKCLRNVERTPWRNHSISASEKFDLALKIFANYCCFKIIEELKARVRTSAADEGERDLTIFCSARKKH